MRKNKCNIVIDADIARSAGDTNHPISSSCRDALELILNHEHKFVACKKLREEWRKHSSGYAKKWLTAMISRKQVCFIEATNEVAIALTAISVESKNRDAALKDAHIVDAARANGKFITSRDEAAKNAFESFTEVKKLTKGIAWSNPVSDMPALRATLKDGNNYSSIYKLGAKKP